MLRMEHKIFARADPEIINALAEYAKTDDRTSSYVVRKLVINLLKDKGFLPKDFDATERPSHKPAKVSKKKAPVTA